jgi:hypothetical protein
VGRDCWIKAAHSWARRRAEQIRQRFAIHPNCTHFFPLGIGEDKSFFAQVQLLETVKGQLRVSAADTCAAVSARGGFSPLPEDQEVRGHASLHHR